MKIKSTAHIFALSKRALLLCACVILFTTGVPSAKASLYSNTSQSIGTAWQNTLSWISLFPQLLKTTYQKRKAIAKQELERKQQELKEEIGEGTTQLSRGVWRRFWDFFWSKLRQGTITDN
ncbi:MAG: hypothetical protein Q8P70_00670 [bacterium]|nr:hypothetical protein [bacterium]